MSELKDIMVRDLGRHLNDRVTTALADFIDRCDSMDIDYEQSRGMTMALLAHHLSMLACAVDATEAEFVNMCRWQFHEQRKVA